MEMLKIELDRHEWGSLGGMGGTAEHGPESILRLTAGETEDEVWAAYWELENYVVVQGQLFEASVYVVPALLTALLGDLSRPARQAVLELLFQIVSGESDMEEVGRGNGDLGTRCRQQAQEGIWILYRELCSGAYDTARDILEIVDQGKDRLSVFIDACSRGGQKKR